MGKGGRQRADRCCRGRLPLPLKDRPLTQEDGFIEQNRPIGMVGCAKRDQGTVRANHDGSNQFDRGLVAGDIDQGLDRPLESNCARFGGDWVVDRRPGETEKIPSGDPRHSGR